MPLFSEEPGIEEPDPLLQRPWISEIRDREERSFHRIQSEIFSIPHFVVRKDRWGREYKIKKNGEIEYLLDSRYRWHFPESRDLVLSYYEAWSLEKAGFLTQSLHLCKSILYCYRLKNPEIHTTEWETRTNDLLNQILRKDREEYRILSDPYGCYHENKLFLSSEFFGYEISLPSDWDMEFSWNPEETSQSTREYDSRFLRFFKVLDSKKERTWEDEVLLSETGEKRFRKEKIIFFLGGLRQKIPVFHKNNFYKIWDNARGLNRATRREWGYKRQEEEPGYLARFRIVDERGIESEWQIREYYYWNRSKGIFLSLSYPAEESENVERIWREIMRNFKIF